MKIPLNSMDQHTVDDDENGAEKRYFSRVYTHENCKFEVQMLFVKENLKQWLAMGIKDTERLCIPAPITARFQLSPPVYAGDNMVAGIRALPKAKAERTEATNQRSKPDGVSTPPVIEKKENSRNSGGKKENGAGTVFMIIGVVCALGAAYYYFFVVKKEDQRPLPGKVIDNSAYSGLQKTDTEIGSYQGPSLE